MSLVGSENTPDDPGGLPQPARFSGRNSVDFPQKMPDFLPRTVHDGTAPAPVDVHSRPPAWMSDELIAETRRVWSVAYRRVISTDEAVEILSNVRRLAEVALRAQPER